MDDRTGIRMHSVIAAGAVLATCPVLWAGGVLIVDNDSRAATIGVNVTDQDQDFFLDDGYNVNPGENEYDEFDFFFQVSAGGICAEGISTLDTFSSFLNFDDDTFEFDGIQVSSELAVETSYEGGGKCFPDDEASAFGNDSLVMGFRVEGLSGGQTMDMIFAGSILTTPGATALVKLTGPGGLNLQFTSGSFSVPVSFSQNGEYLFTASSNADIFDHDNVGNLFRSAFMQANLTVDTGCSADLDGSGNVNGADLGILLGNWGGSGAGDLNGNGIVNGADLGLLLGAWGPC